jgi:hypothetical protein
LKRLFFSLILLIPSIAFAEYSAAECEREIRMYNDLIEYSDITLGEYSKSLKKLEVINKKIDSLIQKNNKKIDSLMHNKNVNVNKAEGDKVHAESTAANKALRENAKAMFMYKFASVRQGNHVSEHCGVGSQVQEAIEFHKKYLRNAEGDKPSPDEMFEFANNQSAYYYKMYLKETNGTNNFENRRKNLEHGLLWVGISGSLVRGTTWDTGILFRSKLNKRIDAFHQKWVEQFLGK